MSLAKASVGQILVPVKNLEQAVAFYRDVLGLPFLFAAPPQMAFFMCGSVRLLLGVPEKGLSAENGSAIYFRVEDIGKTAAALKEKGVSFRLEPHPVHRTALSILWLAEFDDPDGNHLALMSEVSLS